MGDTKINTTNAQAVQQFIARWRGVTTSELATAESFVLELCALLNLPLPTQEPDYMFERPITFRHGDGFSSAGRIDCYRAATLSWRSKSPKTMPPPRCLHLKHRLTS